MNKKTIQIEIFEMNHIRYINYMVCHIININTTVLPKRDAMSLPTRSYA